MPETNYAEILPSSPSEELLDMAEKYWAETNAIVMSVDYINDPLTQLKNKVVHCHCTACKESFYCDFKSGSSCYWSRAKYSFFNTRTNEYISSGSNTLCPECGAPVRVISISDMYRNTYPLGRAIFTEVKNIESKVCIISWEIYKEADKKGKISFDWYRNEAYIADGKKMIRCSGQRRYFNSYQIYSSWMQTKRFDDCLGRVKKETLLPFGEEVIIGTSCENSKLDLFVQTEEISLVSYLRLWQKHPNIENLVMQGHANLVNEALLKAASLSKGYNYCNWRGSTNVTAFDFKKARPHEMLKLSKEDYLGAIKNKLSLSLIEDLALYREYDHCVTPDNVALIQKTIGQRYGEVQNSGESLVKVCNYIAKQEKKYPDFTNRIEIKTLLDYWNMVQTRSEKTGEPIERYPQNLIAKHDQLVELAEFERQKELLEAFAKRAEKLTPFAFADEETGLEIFACPDEAQLIKEGKTLHHCVATYAKRHAQGDTAIFFIRHTDKPDEPFFTLELDEKTYRVRQNRGLRNCARTPEVESFEKKWIEYLKTNNIGKEVKKNGKRNRKSDLAAAVA